MTSVSRRAVLGTFGLAATGLAAAGLDELRDRILTAMTPEDAT